MGFFIAMFLCNLLMPSIMVIAGYCMYKNPPKEINGLIGYRTAMSEKNKDTWAFAHDYCGKLWIKSGIILLVPTVLVQIPFAKSGEDVVGTVTLVIEAVQVLALIGSVILVEKALKRMRSCPVLCHPAQQLAGHLRRYSVRSGGRLCHRLLHRILHL